MLIILVPLVLQIGLLNDADYDNECYRDRADQRTVRRDRLNRLDDRIEREEDHHDFLVLDEQRDWQKSEWSVARRLDLVRRG